MKAPPARDLFGEIHAPPKDNTPTRLVLTAHEAGATPMAWLLSKPGLKAAPKFVPRSLVSRGEGTEQSVFTMPRWLASDRGWLT